jgi:hypothetical protein
MLLVVADLLQPKQGRSMEIEFAGLRDGTDVRPDADRLRHFDRVAPPTSADNSLAARAECHAVESARVPFEGGRCAVVLTDHALAETPSTTSRQPPRLPQSRLV